MDFFFVNSVDGNTYPCGYRGQDNLGRFEDLDINRLNRGQQCTDCDWECFRDPSELAGPVLEAFSRPAALLQWMFEEPQYMRL